MTKEISIAKKDENELISTLQCSLYPGATTESIGMVITYCRHAGLDIMLKPVHIVPMYVKDQKSGKGAFQDIIMPSINLYRIQAARSGCAGISEPVFGREIEQNMDCAIVRYPETCTVTVKRIVSGNICEFTATERWIENYAKRGKDSSAPNAMWFRRPYAQLAKCAEAQALRRAFPEIAAVPTAEEMEGKHYIDVEDVPTRAGKLNESLGLDSPDKFEAEEIIIENSEADHALLLRDMIQEKKIGNDVVSKWLEKANVSSLEELGTEKLKACIEMVKRKTA